MLSAKGRGRLTCPEWLPDWGGRVLQDMGMVIVCGMHDMA